MRILHIITGLETGGAEALVLNIAKKQAGLGHDVAVCAIYHPLRLKERIIQDNVEIIYLGFKNKFNPVIIFHLIHLMNHWHPDIVHTHLIHATLWARVAAFFTRMPVVTTEHNTSNWQRKHFIINLIYRFTSGGTRKIFAISQAVKDAVIKYGKINSNKIEVVYNGIDLSRFQNISTISQAETYSRPVIGTVGRLDPRKGHRYLLEASYSIFSKYPGATILIIGEGEEEDNLKKYIQRHRLPDSQIKFLGTLKDILPYLRMMDVFILPSIQEGFGIVLLEAMAVGTPVIGTDVGGIPEIVLSNETGLLIQTKNPTAIYKAIFYILEHPDEAKTMVKNAKKLVNCKFNIDLLVQKLLNYYLNIIN